VPGCGLTPGHVTIRLNADNRTEKSRNVIAKTKTGSTTDVVMVGVHLDSVPWGPGINDNGSGVAAAPETALQLGSSPQVNNAVRFGFWAAEKGRIERVLELRRVAQVDQLKNIALHRNFDILGSPNPGYFTYNGGQSAPPDSNGQWPRVPEGSALANYFRRAGKSPPHIDADGRSDSDGSPWQVFRPPGSSPVPTSRCPTNRPKSGRHGGRTVRPELPQELRYAGATRPQCDEYQRRRSRLHGKAVRAVSSRPQWRAAP
jgi:hypothetical protein